ncbi:TonB family protein [Novosphingobium lindaniclasticum]
MPTIRNPHESWQGGSRTKGLLMTIMVYVVLLGLFFAQWHARTRTVPPVSLSAFNVAPPASPPEQPREVPPGPEQVEAKEKPAIDAVPDLPPPEIQIPAPRPLPAEKPADVSDPAPPVERTTAPEVRPAPPAQQASNDKATWEGLILAALNKVKRYPREAQFRRQQGVPYIRFAIDRNGKVLSSALERSSGMRSLDEEAVSLPKRAQPLPKPPEERKGAIIELVVPVEFFLAR